MRKKRIQPKVATVKSDLVTRLPLACSSEDAAVAFMEEQRWGDTPRCPRCDHAEVYQMKAADGTRNKRYLWRCRGCKKQFTVRVNSVYEDSPIPLRHWCYAFWAASSSKKGISAMQLHRQIGVNYKSALFMLPRAHRPFVASTDGRVQTSTRRSVGSLRAGTRRYAIARASMRAERRTQTRLKASSRS